MGWPYVRYQTEGGRVKRISITTILAALIVAFAFSGTASAEGGCPSTIAKPGVRISIETWNQLTIHVWTRATSPIETPNGPIYLNGQFGSHIYAFEEGGKQESRYAENKADVIFPKVNEGFWGAYYTEKFTLSGPGVRFPPYAETIKGSSQHECGVMNGTPYLGGIWSAEAGKVWETS